MIKPEILVIYNKGDKRQRYRFIYEPLKKLEAEQGQEVKISLFVQESGLKGLRQAVKKSFEGVGGKMAMIYLGADVSGMVWALCGRLAKKKIILRLGGNQIKTLELLMRDMWEKRKPGLWLRCLANLKASKLALKWADGLIVVNDSLGRKIKESRYLGEDCAVFTVPQPVAVTGKASGYLSDRVQAESGEYRLLTVTNLQFSDKVRAIIIFIEAFLGSHWQANYATGKKMVYDIVGGGHYLEELQTFVALQEQALAERGIVVRVHGYQDDVASWYQQADLFVYGSTHDSLPNVLLEAQMFGLPIVVNDLEEFQELLAEGENAVFHQTGDSEDAARAITSLLARPEMRAGLAQANYNNVRQKFSESSVMEHLKPVVMFCSE